MKKLMLILLFVGLVLLGGCMPSTGSPTRAEAPTASLCSSEDIAVSLTRLHDAAMPEITDEIETLDNQIAKIGEKLDALVEIKTDVDEAIAYYDQSVKEEESIPRSYYWRVDYTREEACAAFNNECYEAVDFRLVWHRTGDEYEISDRDVEVRDKGTGDTYQYINLDMIINNLTDGKSRLVVEQTDISNAKEQSVKVLNDVLSNKDLWKIEEVSAKVYLVNGYGLGYGEQLATGSWYYYTDTGYLEPRESSSIRLRDVITVSLEEPASDVSPPSTPSGELY